MTAEYYKNVYQKTYLLNDYRLRILGNKKVLEKSQIEWRQMLVPSVPCRNKFLVTAVKNNTEADFKVPSCPAQFCMISLLISRIVDVYYS